jgi:hypothetical protein
MMSVNQLSLGIKAFFGQHLPEGAYFLETEDERIFALTATDAGMRWIAYLIKLDPAHAQPVCYQPIVLTPHEFPLIDAVYAKVTEAMTEFRVRLLSGTAHRTVDAGKLELFFDDLVPLLPGEADGKEPE